MVLQRAAVDALENAASLQAARGRSLWQDAWARFIGNKAAVASLMVLAVITNQENGLFRYAATCLH